MFGSPQIMWQVKAPSGRSVACYLARLPTADYELRIVHAEQLLTYEVYRELGHALQRGTAVRERIASVCGTWVKTGEFMRRSHHFV